jgi:hypothetical protein
VGLPRPIQIWWARAEIASGVGSAGAAAHAAAGSQHGAGSQGGAGSQHGADAHCAGSSGAAAAAGATSALFTAVRFAANFAPAAVFDFLAMRRVPSLVRGGERADREGRRFNRADVQCG